MSRLYRFSLPLLLIGTALIAACDTQPAGSGNSGAEQEALYQFFARRHAEYLRLHPLQAAYLGQETNAAAWDPVSERAKRQDSTLARMALDSLKHFNRQNLNAQGQLSYDLFKRDKEEFLQAFRYRHHNWPVNTQEGLHTEVPTFLMNVHAIKNATDAQNYIARLKAVKPLFDTLVDEQLTIRDKMGIIPSKFVYPKVIEACEKIIEGKADQSLLYKDFASKLEKSGMPNGESKALLNACKSAIETDVRPAYNKLIGFMRQLEKKAPAQAGAWSMPDGGDFYARQVAYFTTTDMSPQQVMDFGYKEVARLHAEIRQIMKKVNFNGTLQAFFRYMTDPNNKKSFLPNTEEGKQKYLSMATTYIDGMRAKLPSLFNTLPKAPLVVMAVEKFREASAGTAFYERPAMDGSRPGRFYVNLADMNQAPLYQLEALAYHEGLPGHHMQISISQELKDVPEFRKLSEYTAYVEGWGLYSELVPKEIGFYTDPYSDFGRLSMELLRAARCVVDPGLHFKKWTREEAIAYFMSNTAEPPGECVNAIERYITWPGQATAYMVGKDKILSLREFAKKELDADFDIRAFHDLVLTNGALPLDYLEKSVREWVKAKKKA